MELGNFKRNVASKGNQKHTNQTSLTSNGLHGSDSKRRYNRLKKKRRNAAEKLDPRRCNGIHGVDPGSVPPLPCDPGLLPGFRGSGVLQ